MDKSDDSDDIFSDAEFADRFFDVLDQEGMAASVVAAGLVIAFTRDRINEMVKITNESEDNNVVILIRRTEDSHLVASDTDLN